MNPEALHSLIEKYVNDILTDGEFSELQEILENDPSARRQFRRYLNLDAALNEMGEGICLVAENAYCQTINGGADAPKARRKTLSQWIVLPLAACLLVGIFVWGFQFSKPASTDEAMLQGFAILTRMIDAEWDPGNPNLRKGQVLPAGHLRLNSGLAQVEFFSGATVILQGQTDLEILSNGEARCHSGRIRTHVPPAARGFVLRTPKGDIIDLGTDFAVDVSEQDASVHVFEGEIEIHQESQEVQSFETGQGFNLATRTPSTEAPAPGSFVSVAEFEDQSLASRQLRFEEWKTDSNKLRQDPGLIAYYTFDQPGQWSRTLKNVASSGSERDGAIVGARKVSGRWPGRKDALEFKPTGSRTRVFIPGEFASLSFVCWARIDSLDRQYNALFLSDNFQAGEAHWQIRNDGKLMLSLKHREGEKNSSRTYFSPVIWDLSMSGRWIHLASVFNTETQTVRHYVNGENVSDEKIDPERRFHTTRIGAGEIGNWGLPFRPDDPWFAIRNLNGAIDEFAIFSEALSANRIKAMHNIGKPN